MFSFHKYLETCMHFDTQTRTHKITRIKHAHALLTQMRAADMRCWGRKEVKSYDTNNENIL